ncbi:flagellar biosynthesis protein FlhA [Listeria marthii]|uniref:flagellar biosynthesis protein FlhA n=1 Tax=Listeria marthii TaxID=529731 RepID=UPI00188828E2|nr:flagellar biosynthesis protein FlhA [Listeria marthii]MBF2518707.1 flagellar biosynthesis protein FlhA [Listeria marthii]
MGNLGAIKKYFAILIAVSFVIALIVPLPPFVLDLVLVTILAFSVLVYMRATSIKDWNELKSFPSLLLLMGIFRVSINISTTRAILTTGDPGQVIKQFGNFVIGSNFVVGIVIFIILIVFQFIVANGSSRTAEVAARFTLDALPGKQMAIDADLNQRLITEPEAKEKRAYLNMETEFYGAMDGAGKFVKGDVLFTVLLAVVNIVFGLIVGMVQGGLSFGEAAVKYTELTIGDGIVSQIGSLLMAMSAGVIVTRVFDGSDDNVAVGIFKELMQNSVVVYTLAAMFILMGVFSPLPTVPFVGIGVVLGIIGYRTQFNLKKKEQLELEKEMELIQSETNSAEAEHNQAFGAAREKFPVVVELGLNIAALVKQKMNGETAKDKVVLMRKSILQDLGIGVPGINFKDNTSFQPRGKYEIKVKGVAVASGVLKAGHLLALKTPGVMMDLDAEPTKDPIFGEDGYWILPGELEDAQMKNYQVLEPLSILITHLDVVLRKNLHELLMRQQIKDLIDGLADENQILIDEIKKKEIDYSLIQGVLRQLLKEGISVRDLPTIVEGIIDGQTIYPNDLDGITAFVRERISKVICEQAKNQDGKIYALLLQDSIEMDTEIVNTPYYGYALNWALDKELPIIQKVRDTVNKAQLTGREPVILTRRKDFRFGFVRVLERYQLDVPVLSISELSPETEVEQIALIEPT